MTKTMTTSLAGEGLEGLQDLQARIAAAREELGAAARPTLDVCDTPVH